MAPPQLPPELIADILDITVELLIEEERHLEAHAPLSNRFLLSAALVDCTWNAIATQLLLKRGIVTSGSVPGYLEQVKVHGMGATLRSVRWGEASGGVAAAHAANEDVAFDLLVGTLSGLMDIELVDAGAFRTALPAGHAIRQVHLSNVIHPGGYIRKFRHSPLSHLVITDTRLFKWPEVPEAPITASIFDLFKLLCGVQHFTFISKQPSSPLYIGVLRAIGRQRQYQPLLRIWHFECTGSGAYRELYGECKERNRGRPIMSVFPHLEHLTTHFVAAHFLLTPGSHPNLRSLVILPSPPDMPSHMFTLNLSAQIKLLELVEVAPILENLKVPARWASDALREACEAKGAVLLEW